MRRTADGLAGQGLFMRAYAVVLLLTLCCLSLGAREVTAVRSVETSATTNRIEVSVSDAGNYSVQALNNGMGIRIIVPGVSEINAVPEYLRTSRLIDRVVARLEGGSAIVDVTTMVKVGYTQRAGDKAILVNLAAASGKQEQQNPAPAETPATPAATGQTNLEPRKTEEVQAIKPELAIPSDKDIPTPAPETVVPPAKNDTLYEESESVTTSRFKPWLIALIGAVALALILLVIFKYFKKSAPAPNTDQPARKLEGMTLLFDAETRERMVHKLSEQGWTAREIARELKLSLREVQAILPGDTE